MSRYTLTRLIDDRIYLLEGPNTFASLEVEEFLTERGFGLLVSVRRDVNYCVSWAHRPDDPDSAFRAYTYCFSCHREREERDLFKPPDKVAKDEERPSKADLLKLNEYCLYELAHSRKVPIWFQTPHLRDLVLPEITSFFGLAADDFDKTIAVLVLGQRDRALRMLQEDPDWVPDLLSHATTVETAFKVVESGAVLSSCKATGVPGHKLAREPGNIVNDPPDYFEYVMLGDAKLPFGDWVVYQRLVDRSPTDPKDPLTWQEFSDNFRPAINFIFRTVDLIRHPPYCSDGYHDVKVKDELALDPWLAALVIPQGLPRSNELIALAKTKGLGGKVVSEPFAGSTPESWADRMHKKARKIAAGNL